MKVLLGFLLFSQVVFGQTGYGSIKGSLIGNEEPIIFAKVVIYAEDNLNSKIIGGAYSDFDGVFQISTIPTGTYMLMITDENTGADTLKLLDVTVESDQVLFFDSLQMTINSDIIECKTLEQREIPRGLHVDPVNCGVIIKPEDIRRN